VVALVLWSTVLALLGIIGGARAGGVGGAIGGFFGGAILGALIGAFTAISFSLQVGAAIGVTVTLVAWPAFAALALRDYDWEDLQRRFTPQGSIDAAMETKAFVEARMPGRKGDEEDAA
jgi:predicted lipid-binding transport protein (Tim44 family)